MNIDYLISIINLYTDKDSDPFNKARLEIIKTPVDINCKFIISDLNNPTSLSFPYDVIMQEDNLNTWLNIFKNNSIVVLENNSYDKENDICDYNVSFSNGRVIVIKGFSLVETNNIRNVIYDIKYEKNVIRIPYEKPIISIKHSQMRESGYTGVNFNLLIIIVVLILVLIAVIIFKFI